MLGLKIEQAKSNFFDRKKVLDRLSVAERRILSKQGSFVMTGARRSIKKRKKPSAPGSPPSGHTQQLRKGILFVYEAGKHKVTIGPTLANAKSSGIAPGILERGGQVTFATKKGNKTASIAPRPYMGPALAAEQDKFPAMWANAVKR